MQVLSCASLAIVGMVIIHFSFHSGSYEFMAAISGILLYCIINPVVSIFHESFVKYTWPSWLYFLALMIVLLLLARVVSGTSIWTLNAYRMMLGSITVFYIVTSILVRLVRTIWEFAEEDER